MMRHWLVLVTAAWLASLALMLATPRAAYLPTHWVCGAHTLTDAPREECRRALSAVLGC